jgi:hypothetical protein
MVSVDDCPGHLETPRLRLSDLEYPGLIPSDAAYGD